MCDYTESLREAGLVIEREIAREGREREYGMRLKKEEWRMARDFGRLVGANYHCVEMRRRLQYAVHKVLVKEK